MNMYFRGAEDMKYLSYQLLRRPRTRSLRAPAPGGDHRAGRRRARVRTLRKWPPKRPDRAVARPVERDIVAFAVVSIKQSWILTRNFISPASLVPCEPPEALPSLLKHPCFYRSAALQFSLDDRTFSC